MERRFRQLLVFLHVVTTVGWMGQALAICTLVAAGSPAAAHVVDATVLLVLANGAVYTGLMLAALTQWGYFRHWWVLVKFAITIVQLYLGIFVLSPRLQAAAEGRADTTPWTLVGAAFMASAIAFQAWVSVAKPWSRTPWPPRPQRLPTAPWWLFAAAVAVPVVDYLMGRFVLGFPAPALQFLTAVGYPFVRSHRLRRLAARPAGRAGPAAGLPGRGTLHGQDVHVEQDRRLNA